MQKAQIKSLLNSIIEESRTKAKNKYVTPVEVGNATITGWSHDTNGNLVINYTVIKNGKESNKSSQLGGELYGLSKSDYKDLESGPSKKLTDLFKKSLSITEEAKDIDDDEIEIEIEIDGDEDLEIDIEDEETETETEIDADDEIEIEIEDDLTVELTDELLDAFKVIVTAINPDVNLDDLDPELVAEAIAKASITVIDSLWLSTDDETNDIDTNDDDEEIEIEIEIENADTEVVEDGFIADGQYKELLYVILTQTFDDFYTGDFTDYVQGEENHKPESKIKDEISILINGTSLEIENVTDLLFGSAFEKFYESSKFQDFVDGNIDEEEVLEYMQSKF